MPEIKDNEKLPEGWKRVRLGEVINIYDNRRIPLDSEYRATIKGNIPYCGATGIIDYINSYIFDGEYVLIAEDGGKFKSFEETAYIMKGKFWVNNHAHIVRGIDGVLNNRFLMCTIILLDIGSYIAGSTREKLNQQLLRNINILLPSLTEQRKIAEILETVDNAIEKTEKIIEKYKRLKQGLMQDLLTRGIDENGNIRSEKTHKFKDSPVGRIPEEWEVRRLGKVVEYIQPWKYIVKNEKYDSKHGVPVLTAGKTFILGYTNEDFEIYKDLPAIIFDDFTTESKYISFPFKVKSSALKILKEKDINIDLFFIFNLIQTVKLKPGSEHKRFWISEYSKIQIPFPPPPEQHRIASILSQIDEAIEKEKNYKEKLQRIKQGLMEDLLAGKVRVKHLLEDKNEK